jgi:tRNA pseudouridine13 synthase
MPEGATAPPPDVASGMTVYATRGNWRIVGRLRGSPEDFQVEEVLNLGEVSPDRTDEFAIPVYRVKKRGIDTPHAAAELAEFLKSNVNFAGMKDSNAVTTQYASARSVKAADPPFVRGSRFEAERVGYLRRPISRGMMAGNRFVIKVLTEEDVSERVDEVYRRCAQRVVPNFFGYQRFGLRGMVNHRVGRAILRRDFKGAVELFLGEPRQGESDAASEARRLAEGGRYGEAAERFSPRQDLERRIARHLVDKPGDYLGGLRRVPMTPRRLFVQAYQSYIYNLTMSAALEAGLDISEAERGDNWAEVNSDGLGFGKVHGVREPLMAAGTVALVQLVGYAFRDYSSRFDGLIIPILKEEGVEPSQFYIKEAEEMSNEGGFRQAPLLVKDPAYSAQGGKPTLSFTLGRGEYATTLLREVLKPDDPLSAGF